MSPISKRRRLEPSVEIVTNEEITAGPISQVPDHILQQVFAYLDLAREIGQVAFVAKSWNRASQADFLWARLILKHFPHLSKVVEEIEGYNKKQRYQQLACELHTRVEERKDWSWILTYFSEFFSAERFAALSISILTTHIDLQNYPVIQPVVRHEFAPSLPAPVKNYLLKEIYAISNFEHNEAACNEKNYIRQRQDSRVLYLPMQINHSKLMTSAIVDPKQIHSHNYLPDKYIRGAFECSEMLKTGKQPTIFGLLEWTDKE